MYLEHFGLRESPFKLTPDERFIFLGRTHRLAKLMLDHVWNEDSFVVVTGEIGCSAIASPILVDKNSRSVRWTRLLLT